MKLQDLAAMVTVRNHISQLGGNRNATSPEIYRQLNSLGLMLDKWFVEECLDLDVGRPSNSKVVAKPNPKAKVSEDKPRKIPKPKKAVKQTGDPDVVARLAEEKKKLAEA